MTYERPEALECGATANVILGAKDEVNMSDLEFQRTVQLAVEELE
jgi:hypothetical protein